MVWRDPISAIAAAPEVARLMGVELGWNEERVVSELAKFFATHALRETNASRDSDATNSIGGVDARNASS
jgi:hypothetical protein